MIDFLWNILIYPIELIVEFVYVWFYRVFENPGIATIGVSLVVSTMVLPLYSKAERFRKKNEINKSKWKSG